jgi:class 3 adenylate cyclase
LWERDAAAMRRALVRHDELLREAINDHDGYVFSTAGDAFAAAFHTPTEAVDAAVAAQGALEAEPWATGMALGVRMGLHIGSADERDGDYFGPAVNRAARIMAAGHGGQILLSAPIAALAVRADLVDLGVHRLKDLAAAERLFQVGGRRFPPLATLDRRLHNLPVQRTELIGARPRCTRSPRCWSGTGW